MNGTSGESKAKFIIYLIVAIMAAGGGIEALRRMFTPPSISTVEIKPQKFSLNVGDEKFLSVNQKDTKGNPSTFPIEWSSDEDSIASVSKGTVTALREGNTFIRAKVEQKTEIAEVTVIQEQEDEVDNLKSLPTVQEKKSKPISKSLVPKLTANNSADPIIVSRKSRHLSGHTSLEAFKAFNKDWKSWTNGFCLDAPVGWIKVDFGPGRNVTATAYKVRAREDTNFGSNYTFSDWTFEGSNDDRIWTVIHTPPSQTGWRSDEERNFDVSNAYYRFYRWNVTANEGGEPYSCVQELEIWGYYGN